MTESVGQRLVLFTSEVDQRKTPSRNNRALENNSDEQLIVYFMIHFVRVMVKQMVEGQQMGILQVSGIWL